MGLDTFSRPSRDASGGDDTQPRHAQEPALPAHLLLGLFAA
jgi:hypothetical protein